MNSLNKLLILAVLFPILGRGEGIRTGDLIKLETKAFLKGYVGLKDYTSAMLYYTYLLTFRNNFDFKHLNVKVQKSVFSLYRAENRNTDLPDDISKIYGSYSNDSRYAAMVMNRYKKVKAEVMRNMKTLIMNEKPTKFDPEKEKRIESIKRILHQKYYDIHTQVAKENNLTDKIIIVKKAQSKQLNYINKRRSKK